jgi:hypothetical protein
MSSLVEELVREGKHLDALNQCIEEEDFCTGIFLCNSWKLRNVYPETHFMLDVLRKKLAKKDAPICVRVTCNWCDAKTLCKCWNKMSENGEGRWQNIQLVSENPCDYLVVVNKPYCNDELIENKKKIVVFRMEPNMEGEENKWGEWSKPNKDDFLFVGYHSEHYNNNEWHLAKTYTQLSLETIEKNTSLDFSVSTVLSSKYTDGGHVKRVDFAKYMENNGIDLHVFGDNKFLWKNYKGGLPYHNKNDGLLPYKYTFNAENQSINGYYTEKLIDGILSECLVFYSGPPNIRSLIDERAYFSLNLGNFEDDCKKISEAMKNDMWSERLPYIREAKHRILNETGFFPRLKNIIDNSIE